MFITKVGKLVLLLEGSTKNHAAQCVLTDI